MAKKIEALITPGILTWARLTSGYSIDTICKKMKIDIEKLKKFENGELKPTINQMRRFANYYKRPLAVFYLAEVPEYPKPINDYRRIDITDIFKEPVKLQYEIRRAIFRREAALDQLRELNEKPIEFNFIIDNKGNPEIIGQKFREILKINSNKQNQWKDKYEALNSWISSVENLGVLVFQASGISTEEMRGFSLSEFPLPVIVLNIKDHPHARIFTLLHELAHLSLKESGICDIYEGVNFRRTTEFENVETFCNSVAAASIIPSDMLLNDDYVKMKNYNYHWTDDDLKHLSMKFRASREVVLRRLLTLGKTTTTYYQLKRKQFLTIYDDLSKHVKSGPVPPYRKVVNYNGVSFTNIVIDSYYQGYITSLDLSDYLQANIKHLPKIENEVVHKAQKYGVAI